MTRRRVRYTEWGAIPAPRARAPLRAAPGAAFVAGAIAGLAVYVAAGILAEWWNPFC